MQRVFGDITYQGSQTYLRADRFDSGDPKSFALGPRAYAYDSESMALGYRAVAGPPTTGFSTYATAIGVQSSIGVGGAYNTVIGAWAGVSSFGDGDPSYGYVQLVDSVNINDGESFTLDDGFNPPVEFIFSRTPITEDDTHVWVDISGLPGPNASTLASTLRNLIQGSTGLVNLHMSASCCYKGAIAGRLYLSNLTPGAFGNQTIDYTVTDAGFSVGDMAGGTDPATPITRNVVIGYSAGSQAQRCTVIGNNAGADAGADDSIVIGNSANAAAANTINIGGSALANGGIAIGGTSYYGNGLAIGGSCNGDSGVAVGDGSDARQQGVAIGRNSNGGSPAGSNGTAVGYDAGANAASSTALGHIAYIASTSPSSLAVGAAAKIWNNSTGVIAIGAEAEVGTTTTGDSDGAIAIGYQAAIADSVPYCIAIGQGAQVNDTQGIAIGRGAIIAAGHANATIIGYSSGATAAGDNGVAVGYAAYSLHSKGVAIGPNAQSTAANRCTIGTISGTSDLELQVGLGFAAWGATPPASQPTKIADPTGGTTTDAEARTAINAIIDVLEGAGLAAAA